MQFWNKPNSVTRFYLADILLNIFTSMFMIDK